MKMLKYTIISAIWDDEPNTDSFLLLCWEKPSLLMSSKAADEYFSGFLCKHWLRKAFPSDDSVSIKPTDSTDWRMNHTIYWSEAQINIHAFEDNKLYSLAFY